MDLRAVLWNIFGSATGLRIHPILTGCACLILSAIGMAITARNPFLRVAGYSSSLRNYPILAVKLAKNLAPAQHLRNYLVGWRFSRYYLVFSTLTETFVLYILVDRLLPDPRQ
jgi:hypothetical protein